MYHSIEILDHSIDIPKTVSVIQRVRDLLFDVSWVNRTQKVEVFSIALAVNLFDVGW